MVYYNKGRVISQRRGRAAANGRRACSCSNSPVPFADLPRIPPLCITKLPCMLHRFMWSPCRKHKKDVHTFHNFTEDLFRRITPACTHRSISQLLDPHNNEDWQKSKETFCLAHLKKNNSHSLKSFIGINNQTAPTHTFFQLSYYNIKSINDRPLS